MVEVKPASEDTFVISESSQVSKYWRKYNQVLVTNLRDFVLIGRDPEGNPTKLETYRLAPDERTFWSTPLRNIARQHGQRFVEFLKRVMLHAAPLTSPQDVAWFLASYARDARSRVEGAQLSALEAVRTALEEALGLTFEGPRGDHFFRSTLVQTLFYGMFSAWVLWSQQHSSRITAMFDWRTAVWLLHVPMIRALFEQLATPSKLEALGLVEVLDWTAAALNRVDRETFFAKFEEGQTVQYFYEPFLVAFDPQLRKELGVWYTPREIIRYMVDRVDTVLRNSLDIADGLADPRVIVLDPCCGTGGYLIEVLDRITKTLQARGSDALIANDLKEAATKRVFGFEILPAPFVVSHLQIGLLLQKAGAPLLDAKNERVGVYLTNSLTGWETPDPTKEKVVQLQLAGMPELKEERDAARHVKRDAPILVVLGNPPYNGFAGASPKEEQGLLDVYKQGLKEWGITKNYLDDLYIRFFRLAERRIAEQTKRGVVCYISSFSYLADPSSVVMRQRFLEEFIVDPRI